MYNTRHKIEIYSKDLCPYCDMAKEFFKQKELSFVEHKIGHADSTYPNGFTKQMLLERVPGARTVPQIFIDGKLVGGWTDLINHEIYTS
jgi:glutaredoxin